MSNYPELSYKELKKYCDINNFFFETTEELPELHGIMGQKRAEEAMKFGLGIDHNSYHIYISGAKGTGKTTYTKNLLNSISTREEIPQDWCYVYGFEMPDKAVALNLPAGMGRIFKSDMEELIEDLILQISRAFNSEDYERQKNEINRAYSEDKSKLLQFLSAYAKEKYFLIKVTSTGFVFKPYINEQELTDDDLKEMDDEIKQFLEKNAEEIEEMALEVLIKIKNLERLAKKKIVQLETQVGLFVVNPVMTELMKKYEMCEKVMEHLKRVQKDIVENIYQFVMEEDEVESDIKQKVENTAELKRYKVNLFIDHSKSKGAPVIMEFNPTLNKLTGTIEYTSVNGVMQTNFLHIKPGAIHQANGGYLIIEANKLLMSPYSWEALKRILQTKEVSVENMGSQLGLDVTSLKLEAIPIDLKVILIGNEYLYYLLYHYDEDFQKYFKVLVDFDEEMDRTREHEYQMAQFIASYTKVKKLKSFDKFSVAKLIEYSSRLAGSQNKLSTRFNNIVEIIVEAEQWANLDKSDIITGKHIDKAIEHKHFRGGKYQQRIDEMFKKQSLLIDVKGKKVGVVNGLSVISSGGFSFGKPSVITVTTSVGREGIINIEREVNLSGDIFDKGIHILTGFIMEKFAQDKCLALSARICFEQSYGGIDGDSASSTELYGLLSSLSGVPIRQHIAVTGSVNQKGFIQPIGGATEKIEGFFKICKNRGLTGNQGVMIPYQNIEDLMLTDEIVEAVKVGSFHIYAVKHVYEGIEILTGETFEKIQLLVNEKLEYYLKISEKSSIEK